MKGLVELFPVLFREFFSFFFENAVGEVFKFHRKTLSEFFQFACPLLEAFFHACILLTYGGQFAEQLFLVFSFGKQQLLRLVQLGAEFSGHDFMPHALFRGTFSAQNSQQPADQHAGGQKGNYGKHFHLPLR